MTFEEKSSSERGFFNNLIIWQDHVFYERYTILKYLVFISLST